ncbi:LOW QUALITY PROTEIN: hypothetical protein KUTeg_010630 [Tegillarca granosa]|uniref:Uncharacterized protein n=1 Tax=Tegillarca granosa TaxID=220873 RepID=A0ABQ9F7I4_TEGGR|nr:LOW QUALITY PROTEIN: hypothetical protein KUTeg_010630 [Tegillarca granosa]
MDEMAISSFIDKRLESSQSILLNKLDNLMSNKLSSFQQQINENNRLLSDVQVAKIKQISSDRYKFNKKRNGEQFKVNAKIKRKIMEADALLKEDPTLRDATTYKKRYLKQRQKLIKLADSSKLGWLTAEEYSLNAIAEDSDNEKKIQRAEKAVLRKQIPESSTGEEIEHNHIALTPEVLRRGTAARLLHIFSTLARNFLDDLDCALHVATLGIGVTQSSKIGCKGRGNIGIFGDKKSLSLTSSILEDVSLASLINKGKSVNVIQHVVYGIKSAHKLIGVSVPTNNHYIHNLVESAKRHNSVQKTKICIVLCNKYKDTTGILILRDLCIVLLCYAAFCDFRKKKKNNNKI